MKTSGGVAQCFHVVLITSYPMRRASWDRRTLMPRVCVSLSRIVKTFIKLIIY
jgi:hypothetical protein